MPVFGWPRASDAFADAQRSNEDLQRPLEFQRYNESIPAENLERADDSDSWQGMSNEDGSQTPSAVDDYQSALGGGFETVGGSSPSQAPKVYIVSDNGFLQSNPSGQHAANVDCESLGFGGMNAQIHFVHEAGQELADSSVMINVLDFELPADEGVLILGLHRLADRYRHVGFTLHIFSRGVHRSWYKKYGEGDALQTSGHTVPPSPPPPPPDQSSLVCSTTIVGLVSGRVVVVHFSVNGVHNPGGELVAEPLPVLYVLQDDSCVALPPVWTSKKGRMAAFRLPGHIKGRSRKEVRLRFRIGDLFADDHVLRLLETTTNVNTQLKTERQLLDGLRKVEERLAPRYPDYGQHLQPQFPLVSPPLAECGRGMSTFLQRISARHSVPAQPERLSQQPLPSPLDIALSRHSSQGGAALRSARSTSAASDYETAFDHQSEVLTDPARRPSEPESECVNPEEHAKAVKEQQIEERFMCPLSRLRMIDPIVGTDGITYCRFSALRAIQERCYMPGCAPGIFGILGSNLDKRRSLFEVIPGSEELWRQTRREYIERIALAEEEGDLSEALYRASNALQFLPTNDERVKSLRVMRERLLNKIDEGPVRLGTQTSSQGSSKLPPKEPSHTSYQVNSAISSLEQCAIIANEARATCEQLGPLSTISAIIEPPLLRLYQQQQHLMDLWLIVKSVPEAIDSIQNIFGALESLYDQVNGSIRALLGACSQARAYDDYDVVGRVQQLRSILTDADKASQQYMGMAQLMLAAASVEQASAKRQVTAFCTDGLQPGWRTAGVLSRYVAWWASCAHQQGPPIQLDRVPTVEALAMLASTSSVGEDDIDCFISIARDQALHRSKELTGALDGSISRLNNARGAGASPGAAGHSVTDVFSTQVKELVVAQEWQRESEHLKAKGNDLYRDSEFAKAIICYEDAYFNLTKVSEAATEPLAKACLLNMSICHFQLDQFKDCIEACSELLDKESTNYKALFRRGVARMQLAKRDDQQGTAAKDHLWESARDLSACLIGAPPSDQGYIRDHLLSVQQQLNSPTQGDAARTGNEPEWQQHLKGARATAEVSRRLCEVGMWSTAAMSSAEAISLCQKCDILEARDLEHTCSLQLARCHLELYKDAGQRWNRSANLKSCVDLCTSLLKIDPYVWEALGLRGQARLNLGNAEDHSQDGLDDLTLALQLMPSDAPPATRKPVEQALAIARIRTPSVPQQLLKGITRMLSSKTRDREAAEAARKQELDRKIRSVLDLRRRADIEFNVGKFDRAVDEYEQAIQLIIDAVDYPAAAAAASACYTDRAKCHFQAKQFTECTEQCTKALNLQPYSWEALYLRGQALQKVGNLEEGENANRDLVFAHRLKSSSKS